MVFQQVTFKRLAIKYLSHIPRPTVEIKENFDPGSYMIIFTGIDADVIQRTSSMVNFFANVDAKSKVDVYNKFLSEVSYQAERLAKNRYINKLAISISNELEVEKEDE